MTAVGVGFDRSLRLEWLDLVAGMAQAGGQRREAQDRLRLWLRDRIEGEAAARKTALVLARTWYPVDPGLARLREEALALISSVGPSERLAVHWGLLLAVYPFFRDTAALTGRLLNLQQTFTASQLRQRLVERYGDRAYVERARRHVVLSLVYWGILEMVRRGGEYRRRAPLQVSEPSVERFLLHALLLASSSDVALLEGLSSSAELFPFHLADDAARVVHDPRFSVSTVAGQQRLVSLVG